jgi:hypothetical protein
MVTRGVALAAAVAVLLAACATPIDVGVKGGSASPTRWKVGIPF